MGECQSPDGRVSKARTLGLQHPEVSDMRRATTAGPECLMAWPREEAWLWERGESWGVSWEGESGEWMPDPGGPAALEMARGIHNSLFRMCS